MSDLPVAWILQAKGFYYSSQIMLNGIRKTGGKSYISMEEVYLKNACYKTACYLLAHTIELLLKAIYCSSGGDDVEQFSHNVLKLSQHLINVDVLKKSDTDDESLELAFILLDWYGRYHRPKKGHVQKKIKELWIPCPEKPDMLKRKFNLNNESYGKLEATVKSLIAMVPVSPASIGHLVFDPL